MKTARVHYLGLVAIAALTLSATVCSAAVLCQNKSTKLLKATSSSSCPSGYTKILNTVAFAGPQGPQGLQGLQGPQGDPGSAGLVTQRRFYLTNNTFSGSQPISACYDGFHFASAWEMAEMGALAYDKSLGYSIADSGEGPPAGVSGWVRTGGIASTSGSIGTINCNAWTSSNSSHQGTLLSLWTDWTAQSALIPYRGVGNSPCNSQNRAWCIENAR